MTKEEHMKINSPYFLYMAEAEGITSITSTRQTRINAAIKDFILAAKNGLNINNHDIQETILEEYNLEDLSSKESEYIAKTVMKKIRGY